MQKNIPANVMKINPTIFNESYVSNKIKMNFVGADSLMGTIHHHDSENEQKYSLLSWHSGCVRQVIGFVKKQQKHRYWYERNVVRLYA